MTGWVKVVANQQALQQLGELLAHHAKAPLVIYLEGPLGAGKTTLVRGFMRGLCYNGIVRSPTYTLVEPYTIGLLTVFHFDLYRLQCSEELEFIGARDYFQENSICLIEWPERGIPWLAGSDWVVSIDFISTGRKVMLTAQSEYGEKLLQACPSGT